MRRHKRITPNFDVPNFGYDGIINPLAIVQAMVGGGAYPWKKGDHLVYLGEIPNMEGHCVVVNWEGRVLWGYHTNNFRMLKDDETRKS